MGDIEDEEDLAHGRRDRQFDAMLGIFCKRYGVTEDEIPTLIEKARWSGRHRDGITRISWSAALGLVGIFVSGLVLLIIEGIKHSLTGK